MKKVLINGLYLWQFDTLSDQGCVKHFVTERNTRPEEENFTLSYSSLPDQEIIHRNRRLLASALGVKAEHLFMPRQVHKTRIVNVTRSTQKNELIEKIIKK